MLGEVQSEEASQIPGLKDARRVKRVPGRRQA